MPYVPGRAPGVVGERRKIRPQDLRHLSGAGPGGADGRCRAALHPLPLHVPDVRSWRSAGGGQAVRTVRETLPAEGRGCVPPAAQVQRVFQPGGGRCESGVVPRRWRWQWRPRWRHIASRPAPVPDRLYLSLFLNLWFLSLFLNLWFLSLFLSFSVSISLSLSRPPSLPCTVRFIYVCI